jgi:hypothetical protein
MRGKLEFESVVKSRCKGFISTFQSTTGHQDGKGAILQIFKTAKELAGPAGPHAEHQGGRRVSGEPQDVRPVRDDRAPGGGDAGRGRLLLSAL